MRMPLILSLSVVIISCHRTPDLTQQLKANFSDHVRTIDSAVLIDSFTVIRIDSITERIGQVITDSIFSREKSGIDLQLSSALRNNRKDSLSFLQDEISYMNKEIDSISATIKLADTTLKYGIIAACFHTLKRNNKSRSNIIYYFLNKKGEVLNSEMINDYTRAAVDELAH